MRHHFNARFTPQEVYAILKRIEAGEKQKALAAELHVCPATISALKRQHTYGNFKYKPKEKQTSH